MTPHPSQMREPSPAELVAIKQSDERPDSIALGGASMMAIRARTECCADLGLPPFIFNLDPGGANYKRGVLAPLRALVWARMRDWRGGGVVLTWHDIALATGTYNHGTILMAVKNLRAAMTRATESMT